MKLNAMTASSILVLALAAPVTTAYAQTAPAAVSDTEMQALTATKIAAAAAITSAETASGGKAEELSLDMAATSPGYRVTVISKAGVEANYLVDATTGVASLLPETNSSESIDTPDHDGGNETQDNSSETDEAN